MPTEYAGHDPLSASAWAAGAGDRDETDVAPADRAVYNPDDYADQPGAAARGAGYPRQDG